MTQEAIHALAVGFVAGSFFGIGLTLLGVYIVRAHT